MGELANRSVTFAQLIISLLLCTGGAVAYIIQLETKIATISAKQEMVIDKQRHQDTVAREVRQEILVELTNLRVQLGTLQAAIARHSNGGEKASGIRSDPHK